MECVFSICNISQSGLATLRVLSSHMWPAATGLDSADQKEEKSVTDGSLGSFDNVSDLFRSFFQIFYC